MMASDIAWTIQLGNAFLAQQPALMHAVQRQRHVFAPRGLASSLGAPSASVLGITIGVAFAPWGWGVSRFGRGEHRVFINNVVWNRTWASRAIHPCLYRSAAAGAAMARVEEHRR
jgi:hypothetical protein